jgi:hypothetical protein
MKIPDIMLDKKWTRILGAYLLCLASFQTYIYLCIEDVGNIFLYDPRIGLYSILEMLFHGKIAMTEMMLIEWMSAAWLGFIAVLMCSGRSVIKTYIVIEALLFVLNITVIAILACKNIASTEGLRSLLIQTAPIVMIPTTIIPFAIILMRATITWRK